jgi:hypothetical protein
LSYAKASWYAIMVLPPSLRGASHEMYAVVVVMLVTLLSLTSPGTVRVRVVNELCPVPLLAEKPTLLCAHTYSE